MFFCVLFTVNHDWIYNFGWTLPVKIARPVGLYIQQGHHPRKRHLEGGVPANHEY